MPTSLPNPRWQRRADARPQELLDAAMSLFVERGYAATRLEEVANRAGVSKATLYLYYPGKLELFKAVVRSSLISGIDEVSAALAQEPLSAREQLVRLCTAFMQRVVDSQLSGIPKLIIAEAGNFPEVAQFYHEEVIQRGRKIITDLLARGAAAGEFRPVDSEYAWRILIAPLLLSIVWKHSFQACEAEPLDLQRHLDTHLDLLLNGLGQQQQEVRP